MSSIAEEYQNHHYFGHTCHRWWASDDILVGGTIYNAADWQRLKQTYGVSACVNVENEHSDVDNKIDLLIEARAPDDGSSRTIKSFHDVFNFVHGVLKPDPKAKFYVHCQMGGSRSPAYAYGILRANYKLSSSYALGLLQRNMINSYGIHPFHTVYLQSAELAIATWAPVAS